MTALGAFFAVIAPILLVVRLSWRLRHQPPIRGRVHDPRDDDVFIN
jgi:hypothetical protein